jgi:hypothetical protein
MPRQLKKNGGRSKVKTAKVRQSRNVAAMEGGAPIVISTDTSNEWFLYFAPGMGLFVNNMDIMPSLDPTGAAGGKTAVLRTVDTEARIAPREGMTSNGKKAHFFLQIPKNLRPTP